MAGPCQAALGNADDALLGLLGVEGVGTPGVSRKGRPGPAGVVSAHVPPTAGGDTRKRTGAHRGYWGCREPCTHLLLLILLAPLAGQGSEHAHLTECDTEAGRGVRGPLPKASVSLLTLPPAPTPSPDRQPPPQSVAWCLGWGGGMGTRFPPVPAPPHPLPTGDCHLFLGLRGLGAAPQSLGCHWVPRVPSCAPLSSPSMLSSLFPSLPSAAPQGLLLQEFP